MDVVGVLFYVEVILVGMVGFGDECNSEESCLFIIDVVQIYQLVIKEVCNGLEQVKDVIIEFIVLQWNYEYLVCVLELLIQVCGGLVMILLECVVILLEICNCYIQEQLLVCKVVLDWQSLDILVDVIISVEYYLECLSEDYVSQSDLIFDVVEDSLVNFGYMLKLNLLVLVEFGLFGFVVIEFLVVELERLEVVVEVVEIVE